MASYIAVPRDLTKVKSKVMFNLTKRQLVCFSLAALIGVPSFFLLKKLGDTSFAAMGMMVLMMPTVFEERHNEDDPAYKQQIRIMSYAAGIERNKRMISAEPTARYSNGTTGK